MCSVLWLKKHLPSHKTLCSVLWWKKHLPSHKTFCSILWLKMPSHKTFCSILSLKEHNYTAQKINKDGLLSWNSKEFAKHTRAFFFSFFFFFYLITPFSGTQRNLRQPFPSKIKRSTSFSFKHMYFFLRFTSGNNPNVKIGWTKSQKSNINHRQE